MDEGGPSIREIGQPRLIDDRLAVHGVDGAAKGLQVTGLPGAAVLMWR